MLRYLRALITQMAQTAVCNRHHSLDHQMCRWLPLSMDRLKGNELVVTQDLIANMLGVRREGVTEAAGKLHAAGLSLTSSHPAFDPRCRRSRPARQSAARTTSR